MSRQISGLTEQLQKKEEDVEDMKSGTKGLEVRLEKKNEGRSRTTANNQQTRQYVIFFLESQRRRVGRVRMIVSPPWSNFSTGTTRSEGGRVTTWPRHIGWERRREVPIKRRAEVIDHAQSWSSLTAAATSDVSSPTGHYLSLIHI